MRRGGGIDRDNGCLGSVCRLVSVVTNVGGNDRTLSSQNVF